MPNVSVIIPVYNDAERLRLCLDCLAEQTYPRDDFEVIVVDNGSDEPPRELVEGYPFARFAEESKPGSYAARNRGLELARGQVLAFTDADCRPHASWLEEGVLAVAADGGGRLVGGRIRVTPQDADRPTSAELYDMLYGLNQQGNVEKEGFAATANAFTTRAVIDVVGGFNHELKSRGDVDWGQRAGAASYPVVWCEAAVVDHPARRSVKQLMVQARRHAGGRIDQRRSAASRLFKLRDIGNALRLIAPPLAKFRAIFRRLGEQNYSRGHVVGVCWIAWRLRINAFVAGFKALLGYKTERS